MIPAPHSTLTDEQLVARFRSGDDGAFAEIDRRYRPALLAFAARTLSGSGHDPDDVIQDALIRAFRGQRSRRAAADRRADRATATASADGARAA